MTGYHLNRILSRLNVNNPSCSFKNFQNMFFSTTYNQSYKVLNDGLLKVTPNAVQRLKTIAEDGERLRVEVDGGGCSGFEYKIRLDKHLKDDDFLWKSENGPEVVIDELSLGYMKGATVDFVEDLMKSSFRVIDNPVAEKGCSCGTSFAPKMD